MSNLGSDKWIGDVSGYCEETNGLEMNDRSWIWEVDLSGRGIKMLDLGTQVKWTSKFQSLYGAEYGVIGVWESELSAANFWLHTFHRTRGQVISLSQAVTLMYLDTKASYEKKIPPPEFQGGCFILVNSHNQFVQLDNDL